MFLYVNYVIMMDLETYQARIGQFNLQKSVGYGKKSLITMLQKHGSAVRKNCMCPGSGLSYPGNDRDHGRVLWRVGGEGLSL